MSEPLAGTYAIDWTPRARRDIARLPERVASAAAEFIYGPLSGNPHRVGKALRLDLAGLHAARRADFRIVYRIEDDAVLIVTIDHRSDVYR